MHADIAIPLHYIGNEKDMYMCPLVISSEARLKEE